MQIWMLMNWHSVLYKNARYNTISGNNYTPVRIWVCDTFWLKKSHLKDIVILKIQIHNHFI